MWLASLVAFSLLYLIPGDPIDAMMGAAGEVGEIREDLVKQVREDLGLDDPLLVQYGRWVFHAIQGDLGVSYVRHRPVLDLIMERLPSTLELAAASILIVTVFGLILGTIAALKRGTPIDGIVLVLSLGGVSMPGFWFAMLLILVFSVQLGWLPATGSGEVKQLLLPAVALGYEGTALITRLTRDSLVEELGKPYVTTAYSKGLSGWIVITRHALRNSLIPVVTMLGLQFGRLLIGSIVIEMVFARRGIGQLVIDAIHTKDFPLVQGVILFAASALIATNLIVDICYCYLDPQVRIT
jgi:peptide/nickel transport system permease protein